MDRYIWQLFVYSLQDVTFRAQLEPQVLKTVVEAGLAPCVTELNLRYVTKMAGLPQDQRLILTAEFVGTVEGFNSHRVASNIAQGISALGHGEIDQCDIKVLLYRDDNSPG